jgi:thioredoxin reductase
MPMHEVAIIGAGPAGIAAAVQLRRYGLNPLLLECDTVGGLLRNAHWVENYPGFPGGISGPALVQRMQAHLGAAGVEALQATVTALDYQPGAFHLSTNLGDFGARRLVIASGTKPRRFTGLDIPTNVQTRVFYEVHTLTCLTQQRVAIVGAGDVAFDYALNLAQGNNQILILNRGAKPVCLPLLWERACQSTAITYRSSTSLLRLLEQPAGSLLLECASPAGVVQFQADLLLGALGREPQQDFVPDTWRLTARNLETRGLLYWIGDVKNGLERQTAIAAGDGIRAAMKIYHYLKEFSS